MPGAWLDLARAQLRVTYGHTSHGSQLVTGLEAMRGEAGSPYYFTYSTWGYDAGVFLNDYGIPGADDLGSPSRTAWAAATRALLNRAGGCNRNVVVWSWCGQADAEAADIQLYLDQMNALEADFPALKFVYMTGHLVGSGSAGNLNLRNQQIRDYCLAHDKNLFDFADIESYDPGGATNFMAHGGQRQLRLRQRRQRLPGPQLGRRLAGRPCRQPAGAAGRRLRRVRPLPEAELRPQGPRLLVAAGPPGRLGRHHGARLLPAAARRQHLECPGRHPAAGRRTPAPT